MSPETHTAVSTLRRSAKKAAHDKPSTKNVEPLFLSRDESWLQFNERVLEEAQDPTNPLLERVKFLAITASNLDEFLEIRVAGILQQIEEDLGSFQALDDTGLTLV